MATIHIGDQIINEVSQIFGSLGDVSRLKILRTLLEADEPLCQGSLVEKTGLSQANASKHLALLVRVGLVAREQQGNLVFFKPVRPIVDNVCDLVCGHATARIQDAYRSLA
ncbi:MAG: metalloregulator ArsR/SmtB family transcription factor [Holophaga sp.]|nr:metalloregulator ArsR/SmtB family transcription factor [Holophaga sp.]